MGLALGAIALIVALVGAGWLLIRMASQNRLDGGAAPRDQQKFNEIAIKAIIWLLLCAGLFAAKLWPLAFMVLLAAGGVTAIELWKQRRIDTIEGFNRADSADDRSRQQANHRSSAPAPGKLSVKEASQILGLEDGASPEAIRIAHRKLINQLHPDKGGTDYLASKINQAREIMLENSPKS